jgi:mono/diheme cytochrome c family protein
MLIGAAAAIAVIVPLGAYGFVKSGLYDAAAFKPHTKFTEWLTHDTMMHSVERHAASIAPPQTFTADRLLAGFCQYETHCVSCHGAAGLARQPWVNGMEPAPPYLLDVHQRFNRRQLFWIVQNGIKMTGMPSWRETMSDRQIWDVVAWLETSPKLPPQTYVNWRRQRLCVASAGQ